MFAGLSAFPITPGDDDGQLIEADFSRLVARLAVPGVTSVGILGSTGTYAYLDRATRARAVAVAAEALAGQVPLLAGVGALRTDDAVAHARDAAAAGAQALLLAPVSYTPLTDVEVAAHYTAVADCTDLPLFIYNNPGTTGFSFSGELLGRLARHPRIAGVKMPLPADRSMGDDIAALRARLPKAFVLGYSGDWGCAEALAGGADTWFSVIAGILPDVAVHMAGAAAGGDVAAANAPLEPLWRLFRQHGSLRVVYAMAAELGLTQAQAPRPILPLGARERAEVAQVLSGLGQTRP